MNALANESRMSQNTSQALYAGGTEVSKPLRRALLMDRLVDLLVEKSKSELMWPEFYHYAWTTLKTLRLSKERQILAARRLRNAMSYALAGEHGASTFELRMLRSQLV